MWEKNSIRLVLQLLQSGQVHYATLLIAVKNKLKIHRHSWVYKISINAFAAVVMAYL